MKVVQKSGSLMNSAKNIGRVDSSGSFCLVNGPMTVRKANLIAGDYRFRSGFDHESKEMEHNFDRNKYNAASIARAE
jgi:hypothetical protein